MHRDSQLIHRMVATGLVDLIRQTTLGGLHKVAKWIIARQVGAMVVFDNLQRIKVLLNLKMNIARP